MKAEVRLPYLPAGSGVRPVVPPVERPDESSRGLPPSPRSRLLEPFRDSAFSIGLLLLALSGGGFLLYEWLGDPRQRDKDNGTMIMLHYGVAVGYSLFLLINGHWRAGRYPERRPARWLALWLVSAYALNREMAVFQASTAWLCGALIAVSTAMVAYAWKETVSVRSQQLLYAVLALGWWLFAYMAVYVAQLYPISFPLLIALGLSAHTFVPLTLAIVLGKRLWQDARREEHLRLGVAVGLTVPLTTVVLFVSSWISSANRIERTRLEATVRRTSDLPEWVLVAQQLAAGPAHPDWITNRLLLAGRTYDLGRFLDNSGWGLDGLTSLDDVREHDPLVVMANLLFPARVLSDADNLNVLKVLNGERHKTEEKFWTSRHLTTEDVVSQVRIWPQFRLSYTEKTIRIRNQARSTTEEALFTFHLPAGSVVSAMSLWVNGVEQPARLTTVAKADSAYRTVVGTESRSVVRDPSVVYWQEGNRVTVRVFPCQAGQDRRVKLGITAPLSLENNELVYENPYFEGPDAGSAEELIKIDFAQAPVGLQSPWLLDRLHGTNLTHQGTYRPDWSLRFDAPALSPDSFVLDGRAYGLEPYQPRLESFKPTAVYVDIHAGWTKDELVAAYRVAKRANARAWVFDDGLKEVTAENLQDTYVRLAEQRFSLFPLYRVANPATALLITKGTPTSPTLSDLDGSPFGDRMRKAATQSGALRTFCLGRDPSPYLKTLSELRVLNLVHGRPDELTTLLNAGRFPHQPDETACVVLPEAGVLIRETAAQAQSAGVSRASAAPDHLARLFAYNHLLKAIGRHYFTPDYQTDVLIREAQRAHIVSPLSSLIVLETAADYKRFGIKNDYSGLDNATLKDEGAVPEPHEWALLILVAGLVGWLRWQKRRGSVTVLNR